MLHALYRHGDLNIQTDAKKVKEWSCTAAGEPCNHFAMTARNIFLDMHSLTRDPPARFDATIRDPKIDTDVVASPQDPCEEFPGMLAHQTSQLQFQQNSG